MAGYYPDIVGDGIAARRAGFNEMEGVRNAFARRQAGGAIAGGDMQGGMNALYRAGDLEGAGQLQAQQSRGEELQYRQGKMQQEQQAKEAADKLDFLANIARRLKTVPADPNDPNFTARRQALAGFRQTFQAMGLPDEQIAKMEGADLSDNTLDMFAGNMEQAKWQIIQRRDGSIVGVNQGSLEQKEIMPALPASTLQRNVPFGWSLDEEGNPTVEPTFVQGKAAIARATRAPPRGRGGGGRRSGGGSGKLPPGFILD